MQEPKIISEKEQEFSYTAFARMEDVLNKLKLLKYESEFLCDLKMKPIHSCMGVNVDISPNKLKQGVGEHVVYILDILSNNAIKTNNLILQKPTPPEEKEEEAEVLDDESEINLDRVEEEMMAVYSDDSDEENIFRLDDLKPVKTEMRPAEIKSSTDEESWKLEVERVLPQLKVMIKNDNRDWRSHLEQMKAHKGSIDECFERPRCSWRNYIRRSLQDQLSKIKENYKNISTGVAERNRELQKLSDRLESVKQQMEERGSSMTDGTPLVNIKKSVAKVKAEIIDMDVRIGVLECILLQTKIRDEKLIESEFGQQISVF
ncbi:hypothetical protein NQ317_009727 [Molorchus minor]|uniref:Uncharacterized protein n=1 Tax=Molorchus minor TaxID=1323400 RepID=A0ABQ9JE29_9CUCU|nr:hypothetical protein NQ317_009727 [Molorchus minor]